METSFEFFLKLLLFVETKQNESKCYVEEHFDNKGIEGMSNAELRDYYLNLGKMDMCQEIKGMIVDFSKELVKGEEK